MSRKKTQPKKNIVPDPKFNSTIIPKLINNIINSLEKQYNQDELRKKTLVQFIKKEFSNFIGFFQIRFLLSNFLKLSITAVTLSIFSGCPSPVL